MSHTVSITFSDDHLTSIIWDAHSIYWLLNAYELSSKHITLMLNEFQGYPVINKRIGAREIAEALSKLSCGNSSDQAILARVITGPDGAACDYVLQMAVFGAVHFG